MSSLTTIALKARPFLKWAGGKTQLITQYQNFFPQGYQRYYEPFLGGGAVFFHLQPNQAVLTDINPELINVYQCIQTSVEAVIDGLQVHQKFHHQTYYYQIRATQFADPIERAARFIYLNKTCFNGLYRENSQGQFNVPMGRYKNPKICDAPLLRRAAVVLQNSCLAVRSFTDILEYATNAQDFVYFDPPYYPISATSNFTNYSRYSFGDREQQQLAAVFTELANRGVKVMLSNSDCPVIRDLYKDFYIYPISATRSINSNSQKRGCVAEILVTSYPVTFDS